MPCELMGTVSWKLYSSRIWDKSYIMFLRSIEWQRKLMSF